MTYNVTFDMHPNYLHAQVTGNNSRENVLAYMREVFDECKRTSCFRVLIDEQLEGPRMSTMEIFDLLSEGSLNALGFFEAIAFVDVDMDQTREFAETVAVNRGLPLSTFESVAAAEKWIQEKRIGTNDRDALWDGEPEES